MNVKRHQIVGAAFAVLLSGGLLLRERHSKRSEDGASDGTPSGEKARIIVTIPDYQDIVVRGVPGKPGEPVKNIDGLTSRYTAPVFKALEENHLGPVGTTGFGFEESKPATWHFSLRPAAAKLPEDFALLIKVLKDMDLPPSTRIEVHEPGGKVGGATLGEL